LRSRHAQIVRSLKCSQRLWIGGHLDRSAWSFIVTFSAMPGRRCPGREDNCAVVDPVKELLDEGWCEGFIHAGRPVHERQLPASQPGAHVSTNQRVQSDPVNRRKASKVNHDVTARHFNVGEPVFAVINDTKV
jgi:hypothetical protein